MSDAYLSKKCKQLLAKVSKVDGRTMTAEVFSLLVERAKELGIDVSQFEEVA